MLCQIGDDPTAERRLGGGEQQHYLRLETTRPVYGNHDTDGARTELDQTTNRINSHAFDKFLDKLGVEVLVAPFIHPFQSIFGRDRSAISPLACDGVVHVHDRADRPCKTDHVAFQFPHITRSVMAFMMLLDHLQCLRGNHAGFL